MSIFKIIYHDVCSIIQVSNSQNVDCVHLDVALVLSDGVMGGGLWCRCMGA